MKGLNDTVIVKEKTHTSDGRGGVSTAYTTVIASLTCSVQPVRREELRMEIQGQVVTDLTMLLFENITSGPTVEEGHVVFFGDKRFLVINTGTTSGKGTHTEAIMRDITGEANIT